MGLAPNLGIDVQGHFFRCFAIVEDLQNKPVDLRTGAIVERGERGLIALGRLGDQQSPFLLMDLPRRFQSITNIKSPPNTCTRGWGRSDLWFRHFFVIASEAPTIAPARKTSQDSFPRQEIQIERTLVE